MCSIDEQTERSQALAYSLGTYLKQIGFVKSIPMFDCCPVFASKDKKPYRGKLKKVSYVKKLMFFFGKMLNKCIAFLKLLNSNSRKHG